MQGDKTVFARELIGGGNLGFAKNALAMSGQLCG
jgi:hypothetical protein